MLKDVLERAATDVVMERYKFPICIVSAVLAGAIVWLFPIVKEVILWLLAIGYIFRHIENLIMFAVLMRLRRKWDE